MIATLVEGRALLETIVASVAASVGVTFAFSVAIWGAARFVDLSRDEKPLAATAAAVVASLALTCVAAALVVGIVVMTSK
jgi:hypothetical protein